MKSIIIKIEVSEATDPELLLRDALGEFIEARCKGFYALSQDDRAKAVHVYVKQRYLSHRNGFYEEKTEEVLRRIDMAQSMKMNIRVYEEQ